jgi:putative membrane protein
MAADVDSRLLQANERTLLAWVRTSIALMTFGFVIARIGVWLRALGGRSDLIEAHHLGTAWIGGVFVAMGVIGNALAVRRFAASRQAIRHHRDIPDDPLPVVFAVLVSAFGAVIGAYLLVRLI